MIRIFILLIFSLFLFSCSTFKRPGGIFEVEIKPKEGENFERVEYRLWIPDNIKNIRGIIVRQHGCGEGARKNGLEHADDIQWQALAAKLNCALLGSRMWAPEEDCTTWIVPEDGSARAFLSGLDELAKKSRRPEIAEVPWALWGHSGGAIWATNMTYRFPERVMAAFPRSGGLSPLGKEWPRSLPAKPSDNPKAFEVPIIFCYGAKEYIEGDRFYQLIQGVHEVYSYGRKNKALWSVASHPDSRHENSNSRLLAIEFFDNVIPKRLAKSGNTLRKINYSSGYLVDTDKFDIVEVDDAIGEESKSWLASKGLATSWAEWSKTGNIVDHTPPPAPRDVKVILRDGKSILTWKAIADIQSSVAYFEIFQDDKAIGRLGSLAKKRWNDHGYYHAWNYSDQPLDKKFPPMEFELKDYKSEFTYSVLVINKSGLKSKSISSK